MAPPWTLPLLQPPPWLGAATAAPAAPVGPPGSAGNPLSQVQATAIFGDLAGLKYIPFDYPRDGCFARAHEMCRVMQSHGIECGKAWIYASPGNALTVPGTPMGDIEWRYHVAPIVNVRGDDGVTRQMVIDPSMFSHPVTQDEWKGAMHDPAAVLQTTDSGPYYRDQDSDPSAAQRDDDYSQTQAALEHYSEERDAWKASHP